MSLNFALRIVVLLVGQSAPAPRALGGFPDAIVKWRQDPIHPVVFQGAGGDAWDKKIRERGWILIEDGVYHLWYTGYNDDRSPLRLLGHATSSDGIRWTKDPANPIHTNSWVEDMCVVKHERTCYMFAEGKNDIAHLLTSTDRIRWEERGPLDVRKADGSPIPPGPYGTPSVWVEGDIWYLLYERGDQGVWLATSKDRKIWINVKDDPVLAMGPDPYDKTAVAVNQVIKRDGIYYAFYHANAHRPWKDWTTCVARSRDLVQWEKYPGNPIVQNNSSSGILIQAPDGPRLYTMHPEVRLFRNDSESSVPKKP
jgi:beta-1,2-mannobiose phosphorylase / 1,2-beta-oligomannan phosphorylase